MYILLTDGAFGIENNLVSPIGVGSFSDMNYRSSKAITNYFDNKKLMIEGENINLTDNKDGKLVIIGFINRNNDYDFENAAYRVFKSIFSVDEVRFLP